MVNEKIEAAALTVDQALNNNSLNPIANKPVANKFDQISSDITVLYSDMANVDAIVNALNTIVSNQGSSIANLNAALELERNTRASADNLLGARIDEIASLPEGSTTGDAELIEGNTWHDNYWGVCSCSKCNGRGKNRLGKLLMKVREELRH